MQLKDKNTIITISVFVIIGIVIFIIFKRKTKELSMIDSTGKINKTLPSEGRG